MKTFYLIILFTTGLSFGQVPGFYNINLSGSGRCDCAVNDGDININTFFSDDSSTFILPNINFPGNNETFAMNGNFTFSASKTITSFHFRASRRWRNGSWDSWSNYSSDRDKYINPPYNCTVFQSGYFAYTGQGTFGDAMWSDNIIITVKPILTVTQPVATIITPTDNVVIESHTGFHASEYNWQYSFNSINWVDLPQYNTQPELDINASSFLTTAQINSNLNKAIYFRQKGSCGDVYSNAVSCYLQNFSTAILYDLEFLKNGSFMPLKGKYIVSGWVKEDVAQQLETYSFSSINVNIANGNGAPFYSVNFSPTGNIIDGWQRVLGIIDIPDVTSVSQPTIMIELLCGNTTSNCYFDDIRFFPYNGNLKSFVYNEDTQKLMAELDENNYATFYEYDIEGGLVRVKKETEKGVYTIQETRSNSSKN